MEIISIFMSVFVTVGAVAFLWHVLSDTDWPVECVIPCLPSDQPVEVRLQLLADVAEREKCVELAALLLEARDEIVLQRQVAELLERGSD